MQNNSGASVTFGGFLRQLRRRAGMSQGELAAAVNLSVAQISRLERNERLPEVNSVAQQFVPALGLHDEPRLARRLIELAAAARGERPPSSVTVVRTTQYVVAPDSPAERAPVASPVRHAEPEPSGRVQLPTLPVRMIGRETEIEHARVRLMDQGGRLLTLLGPPGIGKTTLGLALATTVQDLFEHGAVFVPLATASDPAHIAPAILAALHQTLAPQPDRPPNRQLIEYLRRKQLLLLLDNFEQVTPGASLVAEILAACPGVYVLVTSREPLRLRAERRFRVPPLEPAPAIEMFAERVQAIAPEFALTGSNAPIIGRICRALDYLPLAIELVAARVDTFSLDELLAETQRHRLQLAAEGAVDLPSHQHTLRSAIERSYALLSEGEQQLLRALGVFSGGCDAQAVRAVMAALTGAPADSPAEGLASLVAKSLVQTTRPVRPANAAAVRYTLLETIREFALEQLLAHDELDKAQAGHALYYVDLAERQVMRRYGATGRADPAGEESALWWQPLERDHENLRAALRRLLDQPSTGCATARDTDRTPECIPGDPLARPHEVALRLATRLHPFWEGRGYQPEGSRWLAEALERNPQSTVARAYGLLAAGIFAQQRSAFRAAEKMLGEAMDIFRSAGERAGIAETMRASAWLAWDKGDQAGAVALLEESLALFRGLADSPPGTTTGEIDTSTWARSLTAQTLADLTYVLIDPTLHLERARAYGQESLAIFHDLGHLEGMAYALRQLGANESRAGNHAAAAAAYAEALSLMRRFESPRELAWLLDLVGEAVWHQGNVEQAAAYWAEALQLFEAQENEYGVMLIHHHMGQVKRVTGSLDAAARAYTRSLEISHSLQVAAMSARNLAGLGAIHAARGAPERGIMLFAAAYRLFETLPPFLAPADHAEYERLLADLRASLSDESFRHRWDAGSRLDIEQAILLALHDPVT